MYAFPAHYSGKKQVCDTRLFRGFKPEVKKVISEVGHCCEMTEIDLYDLCRLLSHIYRSAFTAPHIASAFESAGIWPLNTSNLLKT